MTINDLKNNLCKHILYLICYSDTYLKNSMKNIYIFYSDKLLKVQLYTNKQQMHSLINKINSKQAKSASHLD